MDQRKGVGHLIDFLLDCGKASRGAIGVAILEHALLRLVQRQPITHERLEVVRRLIALAETGLSERFFANLHQCDDSKKTGDRESQHCECSQRIVGSADPWLEQGHGLDQYHRHWAVLPIGSILGKVLSSTTKLSSP